MKDIDQLLIKFTEEYINNKSSRDETEEVIKSLLEKGANPEAKDKDGKTATNLAFESLDIGIIVMFLPHEAEKEARVSKAKENSFSARLGRTTDNVLKKITSKNNGYQRLEDDKSESTAFGISVR